MRRFSHFGCPTRSYPSSSHDSLGIFVVASGLGLGIGPTTWQPWHNFMSSSTSWPIPGHQLFTRNLCFVQTIPWWPSWAICIIYRHNDGRIKILSLNMMMLWTIDKLWCIVKYSEFDKSLPVAMKIMMALISGSRAYFWAMVSAEIDWGKVC